jgi:endonuclease/exonuclease/phosphatase family metal-dependent hydrolase
VDGSVPGDAGVATDAAPVPDAADAATPDAATADAATADAATPDAATPDAATPDAATPDAGPRQRVRVMAANLTSGNYQTYNGTLQGGPAGIRIMQGLQPDVILVQEFNYDTNGDRTYEAFEIAAMVDLVCGSSCFYARGPGSSSGMIPNGVISRFPILASGEWDDPQISNREFFYAVIDLPGPRDLWAVSIHLSTDLTKRTRGGQALAQHLVDNVPDTYFLVVGGDLNTDTADEPAVQALDSRLETLVFPVDQAGVTGTSANRNKPYDRVMPDDTLEAYRVPVVVGSQVFPTGLVFDSRVYTPLSDVPPVQEGDSAQASMQHMAVIKDFLVPAGQP